MSKIDQILENLNEQQLQAVTTTEGYVRVIAGAGSGKTKALTSRYAYLVESLGINASNILCVTFTNKAANEMRSRVRQILGDDKDYGYIATYHGFCVKVLREDINKIQYPKQFVIMDIEDQKTVLKDIYEELGLNSKDFSYKQAIGHIRGLKIRTNYVEFIAENKGVKKDGEVLKDNPNIEILDKIFLRYLEKQQRNFALDFDDLIEFVTYIFDRYKDVLEKWQKRLHYIMVDEFQDSSIRQYDLVNKLSQVHKNLFVVGDPDQTIYEWRGAKPEFLVDFDKVYPETQNVIMNQNYRSTPNILNLGNHIIKNNKMRVDKDMFTTNSEGVDVIHYHAKNDFDEGLFVATEIQRIVKEENKKYSDFTILYRANHVSRTIEQSLIKEGIPYSIWGGIRFFERAEIKDVLSYLRLIVFGDDLSFLRIINTPSRKLGKVFINEIKQISEQNGITLFEAIASNSLNRANAVEFVDLIKEFRRRKDEISVSDLVQEILDKTGLTEMYRADGDEDRLKNIMELQNSIMMLEKDDVEKLTLENYLQEIALYTDMDVDDGKNDRVKLMTIHTAKGLEFPYVFLCGFTDGVLPSFQSIGKGRERAMEEERRLVYVAITRAEKAFYMTEAEGYNFQTGKDKHPSRFLFEIKENLYVRQGVLAQEIINAAKRQIRLDEGRKDVFIPTFEIGDFISHNIWGKGEVVDLDEDLQTYIIEFENLNAVKSIRSDWEGLTLLEEDDDEEEGDDDGEDFYDKLLREHQPLNPKLTKEIVISMLAGVRFDNDFTILTECSKKLYDTYRIPDGVVSIQKDAFFAQNHLTSIFVPNSVKTIEDGEFGLYKITAINVAEGNDYFCSIDGVLFNKDKTVLIQYPRGKKDKSYTIPDGVTTINKKAFESCAYLKKVNMSNSVKTITKELKKLTGKTKKQNEINYEENAIVHHDKFGKGVIKSVKRNGEEVVVLFDTAGEKTLLTEFAYRVMTVL
ncbi:MAG: UvrD-helicase domain-containing protein [Bacteroidales bacterium]|jgi:DNA helicase-2/ATP-dependent DNA helicase PcrA|nr:UvrD-helicase domain-containing protein [Bacteroidales bacterium]